MGTGAPIPIPFPTSSFPGQNTQEGAGRLINCYCEELGPQGPAKYVWRRSPGLSQHAATAQSGYRGGLIVNNLSYECWQNNASTVDASGNVTSIGNFPGTKKVSIARNQASPTPDVVAVDVDNGAYVLESAAVTSASATGTVGGTTLNSGDIVSLTVLNEYLDDLPVSVSYTLGASETTTTIATGLAAAINANSVLSGHNISATSAAAVLTVSHQGAIGNSTNLAYAVTSPGGTGNETIIFNPSSGDLAGGAGTPGAFNGTPTAYNGQGSLPQPCSVCFQDGYLFFLIADGRCFATALNSLTMNALTEIKAQAKSDVIGQRCIAYSGLLFLFTTGSCEVWQDGGNNPAPAFPYSRISVLETGLAQSAAIAGWETGFSQLMWVAQDFGVYWLPPGSLAPIKASPPDLDRLIETEIRAGNTLEAGCYSFGGKKFWHLSCSDWTWEFNIETQKWNERQSLSSGSLGRWRGTGGHPAFGKWLIGDEQSGNLLWIDSANFTENGSYQLFRLESAPVKAFPYQVRIARADFDFVKGTGIAVNNITTSVKGAASGTNGVVRLEVQSTAQMQSNDTGIVSGIVGTTEANGTYSIVVIDATHIELPGTQFVNAYTSGGSLVDVTSQPNQVAPSVAVSCSKDGGYSWGNPLIRQIGQQGNTLRGRVSVKNMGLSGTGGVRWRLDVSDAVYTGFMGGTQSSDPRSIGA